MPMDQGEDARAQSKPVDLAEGIAITASLLCLVHCLFLPLLLAWSPAVTRALDLPFDLHLWIVLIAGPMSLWILLKAARQQRLPIMLTGVAGLGLLAFALVVPVTETMEIAISSIGSVLLAAAHLANWMARHPKAHIHAG